MTNLYNNTKTAIKDFVSGFYAQKIHIDFLECILENQKDRQTQYANNYSLVIKPYLKSDFKHTSNELDEARHYLLGSDYINESHGKLNITEDGKLFVRKYNRFMLLGRLGKFTAIGNKNFTFLFSLTALIISGISLCHSLNILNIDKKDTQKKEIQLITLQ